MTTMHRTSPVSNTKDRRGHVFLNLSMSLDGYITGPNVGVDLPLGEGGTRLHEWLFRTPACEADALIAQEMHATIGAAVLGKGMFDVGVGVWGDTPFPVPCFVLTHAERDPLVAKSGIFTFVNGSVERAIEQARAAAGEKHVHVLGGAAIARQCIEAGLLDEVQINLVSVLLGGGTRLFAHQTAAPVSLEQTRVIHAPGVTHITYRVAR